MCIQIPARSLNIRILTNSNNKPLLDVPEEEETAQFTVGSRKCK